MLCQFGVMRDDQQRGAGFGAAREEQFDDFVPGRSIEIAGGFVGENQVGAGGEQLGLTAQRRGAARSVGRSLEDVRTDAGSKRNTCCRQKRKAVP